MQAEARTATKTAIMQPEATCKQITKLHTTTHSKAWATTTAAPTPTTTALQPVARRKQRTKRRRTVRRKAMENNN
jgi:hypothetical protein